MMRFQRVSPDCLPIPSSKKTSLRTSACKEDNNGEHARTIPNHHTSNGSSHFESKGFRFRSPSRSHDHHNNHHSTSRSSSPPTDNNHHHRREGSPSPSPSRGTGDMLLQWGQRKRARVPRMVSDDSSSSGQAMKGQKKTSQATPRGAMADKPSTTAMPPPPPPLPPPPAPAPASAANGRVGSLRKESSGILPSRNLEERSGVANRSPSRNSNGGSRIASRSVTGKRSPSSPDKTEKKMPCSGSAKDEKANGSDHRKRVDSTPGQSEQETGNNNKTAADKSSVEVVEWPRIYISLSRKEKEDDFLAMKGTKLPHRPKKRAKNVDKALQYCFPGMWLSDLTKSRYEVREKKCVKKQKRRGLKGMESLDSDSE